MALKDTLRSINDRARQQAQFEANKPRIIKQWTSAVTWLESEIQNWLAEYIREGSIKITTENITITEDSLGTYQTTALNIHAASLVIRVQPVARVIIGGVGRVDMYRHSRSSDEDRYRFLRLDAELPDKWAMRPPSSRGRSTDLEPLTPDRFEAAVDALLR